MVNSISTVWYATLEAANTWAVSYSRIKTLHDLSDLTPQSAPQPKPEEPQEDYSKIILDISQIIKMTLVVNHLHKFAGVILFGAGHVGPLVVMRIRLTLN